VACLCTDLLDDVEVKLDLAISLINTILGLLTRPLPAGGPHPVAIPYREKPYKFKKEKIRDELNEIKVILSEIYKYYDW
jgi:hypothetical protein